LIVGLTGGIGSGKSTVANNFRALGIEAIDADQVARDVVKPGTEALRAIQEHFGDGILVNGELNRNHLRELIFAQKNEKLWLENLLHPIIRTEMFKQLEASKSVYTLLEAPLLMENQLDQYCAKTIVVDLSIDDQLLRASTRDATNEDQVLRIINAQMPREDKLAKADYVIDNSGTFEDLEPQILRLDQILRLMASTPEFL
jgi:dephospho-CoA kinase